MLRNAHANNGAQAPEVEDTMSWLPFSILALITLAGFCVIGYQIITRPDLRNFFLVFKRDSTCKDGQKFRQISIDETRTLAEFGIVMIEVEKGGIWGVYIELGDRKICVLVEEGELFFLPEYKEVFLFNGDTLGVIYPSTQACTS